MKCGRSVVNPSPLNNSMLQTGTRLWFLHWKRSRVMKGTPAIWILSAVIAVTLYLGGYFIVVGKRLRDPFISWPIMRPLPMSAYCRVKCFEIIYAPVVRLDWKLFPARWVFPPTAKEQYETLFRSVDLNRIHEMAKLTNNPQGGMNRRQPFSSETDRGSAAASSHRSP